MGHRGEERENMRVARSVRGVVLACCSSGGNGDSRAQDKNGIPQPGYNAKPRAELKVPLAYDPAKGWDAALNWVPGLVRMIPVTAASRSGVIAMMHAASDGYTAHPALDGRCGDPTPAWRSHQILGQVGASPGRCAYCVGETRIVSAGNAATPTEARVRDAPLVRTRRAGTHRPFRWRSHVDRGALPPWLGPAVHPVPVTTR